MEEATSNSDHVDRLIEVMQVAFNSFDPKKFNCSFLTLQGCLEEIILVNDNKNYDIPHKGEAAFDRAGMLPDRLPVRREEAIELARTFLDDQF